MWNWIKSLFCCNKQQTEVIHSNDIINTDYTISDAFEHTWTIVEFAKKHGKMQIRKCPETNNRESYWICRFLNSRNESTYVYISSRLQGVSAKEFSEQRDFIKVGQTKTGNFVLFDFRSKKWEDVDLGLQFALYKHSLKVIMPMVKE